MEIIDVILNWKLRWKWSYTMKKILANYVSVFFNYIIWLGASNMHKLFCATLHKGGLSRYPVFFIFWNIKIIFSFHFLTTKNNVFHHLFLHNHSHKPPYPRKKGFSIGRMNFIRCSEVTYDCCRIINMGVKCMMIYVLLAMWSILHLKTLALHWGC